MNIEEKMREDNKSFTWRVVLLTGFIILMLAGFVLGCFLPALRPTVSDLEKRDLEKFPEFSWDSFWDGSYTSDIETWFADTFPFREELLTAQMRVENYYGIRKDSISAVSQGDDTSDIDDLINSLTSEAPSGDTSETTVDPSETASTEGTTAVVETAETTTEKVYEDVDGKEIQNNNPFEAGNVNVVDLKGYCVYGFNLKAADIFAEDVAAVADALPDVNVYDIMVPDNSAVMLDDETKASWNLPDEEKVIHYYQAKIHSLNSTVTDVDIYETLRAHNDEYLYFYTDHHWTQLGAYYAYTEFCKVKGIDAHSLDEYEQVITTDFLGSYYSTNGYTQLEENPDTIYAYVPLTTNTMHFMDDTLQAMRQGKIIRDMNEFKPTQKYMGFIYGDNSLSYIESETVKNGEVCMVIKESFGNTFVPFLADHYEKVIVIDYRAYKDKVADLAKEENVTDIIFINNLEAISDVYTMETLLGGVCK